MKRTLIVCAAAVALGASVALAASPQVAAAIEAIQSVEADTAKMELFCDLIDALDDAEDKAGAAAKGSVDPALDKQVDAFLTQIGSDFETAWDVGEDLDENSADSKEYGAAIDALADKCE